MEVEEFEEFSLIGLEASASLFIFVCAVKLYKMKIRTHSGCCGDKIEIDTENAGSDTTPMDGVLSRV